MLADVDKKGVPLGSSSRDLIKIAWDRYPTLSYIPTVDLARIR
jgi:hypothetical protein